MTKNNPWICPQKLRIPDFIICGAMKCGTTSLHHILAQHPDVLIPEKELHFFDIDDTLEHPDFSFFDGKKWITPRLENNPEKYWKWYSQFFNHAQPNQLIGEDSTIYLASQRAAERIALQDKPIKTIVILRQPTSRAYSEYWHRLYSGRIQYSYEDQLRFEPGSVLRRSLYLTQVQNFLKHIPRERVHFILFENFIEKKENVVTDLCHFLEIDFKKLPAEALKIYTNKALIPRSISLSLIKNKYFRENGNSHYLNHLPEPISISQSRSFYHQGVQKVFDFINPLHPGKPPAMNPDTKKMLDVFFEKELKGIDELTGLNAMETWFR